ncbi:MAG: hypothetical protein Q7T82_21445 [Armatimonadota bacterium]|nr:hypothetical protein [Armatimonadota bacterium]
MKHPNCIHGTKHGKFCEECYEMVMKINREEFEDDDEDEDEDE